MLLLLPKLAPCCECAYSFKAALAAGLAASRPTWPTSMTCFQSKDGHEKHRVCLFLAVFKLAHDGSEHVWSICSQPNMVREYALSCLPIHMDPAVLPHRQQLCSLTAAAHSSQ
jgi:hypothetical protein